MNSLSQYISYNERISLINDYITEKLHLKKGMEKYIYFPKSTKELKGIVTLKCQKSGKIDLTDIDISGINEDNALVYLFEFYRVKIVDMRGWDLSKQKDIHGMFWCNKTIEEVYVDGWDTSNITSMYGVFKGCENLKVLDVSNWNVENCKEYDYMFENCKSLPDTFNVDKWKVPEGSSVINMFAKDKQLKQPIWWTKI